jgi:hypothetical protein
MNGCPGTVCLFAAVLLLSACATDTIDDRRFGQQVVCHDGNQTLAVSNADSFVHLNHGDSPGPCPEEDEEN